MATTATFYHADCPVCNEAERRLNLVAPVGEDSEQLPLKYQPWLDDQVFHKFRRQTQ